MRTIRETQGRRRGIRLLIVAVTLAAVSFLTPAGPSATSPAGAWGGPVYPGCGATGYSGRYGSWYGITNGSTCGSNQVRFRSWGFVGTWDKEPSPEQAVVTDSTNDTWWGGADHRSCDGCTILGT